MAVKKYVGLRLAVDGIVQAAQRDVELTGPAFGTKEQAAAAIFTETALRARR